MSKLINLQVFEAKNVICGVEVPKKAKEYGNYGEDFWCGIGLNNAKREFIIPTHIIIGVFDDGSIKCAGITNLNRLNEGINPEDLDAFYSSLFYFDTIIYKVGFGEAKSFVQRYHCDEYDKMSKTEKDIKEDIYYELVESGVEIDEGAKNYLLG